MVLAVSKHNTIAHYQSNEHSVAEEPNAIRSSRQTRF